jgi:hypothetical protein
MRKYRAIRRRAECSHLTTSIVGSIVCRRSVRAVHTQQEVIGFGHTGWGRTLCVRKF